MLLLNLRIACRDTFEVSLLPGSVRCGRQPSKSLQRALCCTMLGQVSCWKHAEILVNQTWLRYQRALVTGGLRGLGLRVAKWLADNGRSHRSPSSVCHFVFVRDRICRILWKGKVFGADGPQPISGLGAQMKINEAKLSRFKISD